MVATKSSSSRESAAAILVRTRSTASGTGEFPIIIFIVIYRKDLFQISLFQMLIKLKSLSGFHSQLVVAQAGWVLYEGIVTPHLTINELGLASYQVYSLLLHPMAVMSLRARTIFQALPAAVTPRRW